MLVWLEVFVVVSNDETLIVVAAAFADIIVAVDVSEASAVVATIDVVIGSAVLAVVALGGIFVLPRVPLLLLFLLNLLLI